jgi:radical SAM protein with 4Fe4S-binding SPASM domain
MKSSTPRINLTFTTIGQNEKEVTKFKTMWRGVVDEVHVGIGHNWAGKQSNVMELKPRVYPCKALWSSFVINWNGDVAMCCVDYETTIKLGNVQNESMLEIWNGSTLKELRDRHLERNFDGLICKNCPGEATMPWLSWWADH